MSKVETSEHEDDTYEFLEDEELEEEVDGDLSELADIDVDEFADDEAPEDESTTGVKTEYLTEVMEKIEALEAANTELREKLDKTGEQPETAEAKAIKDLVWEPTEFVKTKDDIFAVMSDPGKFNAMMNKLGEAAHKRGVTDATRLIAASLPARVQSTYMNFRAGEAALEAFSREYPKLTKVLDKDVELLGVFKSLISNVQSTHSKKSYIEVMRIAAKKMESVLSGVRAKKVKGSNATPVSGPGGSRQAKTKSQTKKKDESPIAQLLRNAQDTHRAILGHN